MAEELREFNRKNVERLREAFKEKFRNGELLTSKINKTGRTEYSRGIVDTMLDVQLTKGPEEYSINEFELPSEEVRRNVLKIPKGFDKDYFLLFDTGAQVSNLENQIKGIKDTITMLEKKRNEVLHEAKLNNNFNNPIDLGQFDNAKLRINEEIKILELGETLLAEKLVLWTNKYLKLKLKLREKLYEMRRKEVERGRRPAVTDKELLDFVEKFKPEEELKQIRKTTLLLTRPTKPSERLLSQAFIDKIRKESKELEDLENMLAKLENELRTSSVQSGGLRAYRKLRRKRIGKL